MSDINASNTATAPIHRINQIMIPGDIVYDVGANIGNKTADFLKMGVSVISIEPQPACVETLKRRFQDNPNVVIIPKGLGNRVGLLEMSINSKETVLSTFSHEWKNGRFKSEVWDKKIEVPITTLDNLIQIYGSPRYLKVDVEGFEYEVISGLTKRVGVISIEFTDEFINNSLRIIKYLDNIGYTRFNLSIGEQLDFFLPQWFGMDEFIVLLVQLCEQNKLLWGDIYAN